MSTILKAENISKQYRLGLVGTGTLKHDVSRFLARIRGKEDPFLKVGAENDRSAIATEQYVWALKDISFDVKQGEVLGIIGKNGAGKSTLLKILSRVTSPTTGTIKTKGRIASLLEVGTGFHPELTGRENIYLNGAILGMSKSEIKAKEEEIIDFSGCAMYIDTPVKRYSSGMRVRLAFAVAAHLEPDILVIDEVLAVGDAEFQKKAIGKMQDISKGEGRTVLFVSHNMAAVKSLCTRGIVLEYGKVVFEGSQNEAVDRYLLKSTVAVKGMLSQRTDRLGSGQIQFQHIDFLNQNDEVVEQVLSGEYLKVRFHYKEFESIAYHKLFFGIGFKDHEEGRVVSFFSDEMGCNFSEFSGRGYFDLEIPALYLRANTYHITVQFGNGTSYTRDIIDLVENASELLILPADFWNTGRTNRPGNYAIVPGKFV